MSRLPRGTGINDYDVIYFGETDLSFEAAGVIEVRSQARVHLWFERRFGALSAAAIGRSSAHPLQRDRSSGARPDQNGSLDIAAPFGLDDVFGPVPRTIRPAQARPLALKGARAKDIWPDVKVLD